MKKSTLWLWLLVMLAALGCGKEEEGTGETGQPDQLESGPVSVLEKELSAKVVGKALEVYFPLTNTGEADLEGSVTVRCRHLGSAYEVSGSADFTLASGKDTVAVHLDEVPAFETQAQEAEYVVEYHVTAGGYQVKGNRSLFMLLPKSDLILMMPEKLYSGQKSLVRAYLIDPRTGAPLAGQEIKLDLAAGEENRETLTGKTDENGVALFETEGGDPEQLTAKCAVVDGNGEVVETGVSVVRESRLLLTTDKPMYQPGQKMHLRALALDRFDLKPLANDVAVFEVMDAKGNKVFKAEGETNEFGVAWGEFQLGNQVLLGPYTVRVTVGDVVSEKVVTVDRYSLPKFKIGVDIEKSFYMPGQTVKGSLQVDYFFGKPVEGGKVTVVPYEYKAEWVPMTTIEGETNESGLYPFEFELPTYLVGQPVEGGKAMIMVEFTVVDQASHEQKVARNIVVTDKALDVVVIPESGEVVPDVANTFFLFVTDPNGNPVDATCKLTVNGAELDDEGDEVKVPPTGPAKVSLIPHQGTLALTIAANDGKGGKATANFSFSVGSAEAGILLRTDKSLYKVGETMEVTAYVANAYQHLFLDIVRKGQTVLTKTLTIEDGIASLQVDLDGTLTEDLVLDAYILADSGQFIRDTRVVYVQPATDLSIEVTADQDEYLPGDSATIQFKVTDVDKKPVQSALGLQVVDEAVFALSEMKPGLMELYFRLEDELANPTYQIGQGLGLSLGGLMAEEAEAKPGSDEEGGVQDKTAAAFAAMGGVAPGQTKVSSWGDALKLLPQVLKPYFDERKAEIVKRLSVLLLVKNTEYYDACPVLMDYLSLPREWDFWGNPFLFTVTGGDWDCSVTVRSMGPDELDGTSDDWSATLNVWDLTNQGPWKGGDDGMPMAGGAEENGNWNFAGAADAAAVEGPEPPAEPGEEGGDKAGVKVRSWFPETLFVAPSVITDEQGKAQLTIPLADSITEWRMTTLASSKGGQLGSRDDGIVVFQDFFVDIDFPKYLTQNDQITFPVAIYNYLESAQTVSIELTTDDWFDLLGEDKQVVMMEPGEVSVVSFPVRVTKVGWHSLTVYGLGEKEAKDAIKRTVEVKPDGKEIANSYSARFKNDGKSPSTDQVQQVAEFPDNSIDGARFVVVKVLPGLSTHIVEGMESMLQLPGG